MRFFFIQTVERLSELNILGFKSQIFHSEPVSLKIERPELEFIFRGGQAQSPWVVPNQSPKPNMQRSVSVIHNSAPPVSEPQKASSPLSKVVGVAMKTDSLSRATGKKVDRQEVVDKGEKAKGESLMNVRKCIVLEWKRACM